MTPEAPAPTPAGQATQTDFIPEFEALLVQAIQRHDLSTMQSLMGDSFVLAFWQSEGLTLSPGQAIEQLRLNYLLPGDAIRLGDCPC